MSQAKSAEKVVQTIRRKTRRRLSDGSDYDYAWWR